jgi:hypothetical protein
VHHADAQQDQQAPRVTGQAIGCVGGAAHLHREADAEQQ